MVNSALQLLHRGGLFGLAWSAFGEASDGPAEATWTPVGGETAIPYGWVDFCNRHAEECALGKLKPVDVHMTRQVWKTLNDVNAWPTRDRADQQCRPLGHHARPLGLSGRRQGRLQDLCAVQAQAPDRARLPPPGAAMTIVRDLTAKATRC